MLRDLARALFAAAAVAAALSPALARLRGHDGPVRAIAVTPDGARAVSAGFDSRVVIWDLAAGAAAQLVRPHESPATAVAASAVSTFASADQNGRVAIWRLGAQPRLVDAHRGPISALAATPDGTAFLSVGWDGALRRVDVDSGAVTTLSPEGPPLSGVCAQGEEAVILGSDGAARWISRLGARTGAASAGAPALSLACDGDQVFAGLADGRVLRITREGGATPTLMLDAPVSALAARAGRVAAADAAGAARLSDRGGTRDLTTPRGEPIWGLAFAGDELLAAGHDGLVRRYDLASGRESAPSEPLSEEAPVALRDHPGARVFEACRACHSLRPGEHRAGPTLAGVVGRRVAGAPGYVYSEALRRLDFEWSGETLARLFEIGPAAMTPGSKMPEQRVPDPAERAALIDYIATVGR